MADKHGGTEMNQPAFTCITLRALLRLYQVKLRPLPDGR